MRHGVGASERTNERYMRCLAPVKPYKNTDLHSHLPLSITSLFSTKPSSLMALFQQSEPNYTCSLQARDLGKVRSGQRHAAWRSPACNRRIASNAGHGRPKEGSKCGAKVSWLTDLVFSTRSSRTIVDWKMASDGRGLADRRRLSCCIKDCDFRAGAHDFLTVLVRALPLSLVGLLCPSRKRCLYQSCCEFWACWFTQPRPCQAAKDDQDIGVIVFVAL